MNTYTDPIYFVSMVTQHLQWLLSAASVASVTSDVTFKCLCCGANESVAPPGGARRNCQCYEVNAMDDVTIRPANEVTSRPTNEGTTRPVNEVTTRPANEVTSASESDVMPVSLCTRCTYSRLCGRLASVIHQAAPAACTFRQQTEYRCRQLAVCRLLIAATCLRGSLGDETSTQDRLSLLSVALEEKLCGVNTANTFLHQTCNAAN